MGLRQRVILHLYFDSRGSQRPWSYIRCTRQSRSPPRPQETVGDSLQAGLKSPHSSMWQNHPVLQLCHVEGKEVHVRYWVRDLGVEIRDRGPRRWGRNASLCVCMFACLQLFVSWALNMHGRCKCGAVWNFAQSGKLTPKSAASRTAWTEWL